MSYNVAQREANKEEAMKRMQEEINYQRETILELKACLKAIVKLAS